jgi:hypothetical protein
MFRESSLQLFFCLHQQSQPKVPRPASALFQWPTRTRELAFEGLPYDLFGLGEGLESFWGFTVWSNDVFGLGEGLESPKRKKQRKNEWISHIVHNLMYYPISNQCASIYLPTYLVATKCLPYLPTYLPTYLHSNRLHSLPICLWYLSTYTCIIAFKSMSCSNASYVTRCKF